MKRFLNWTIYLFLGILILTAACPLQATPGSDIIAQITAVFLALFGWPAFLAAAINILKYFKLPDGAASQINFWANIVAWVVVAYFVFTGQTTALNALDGALAGLAKILVDALILIGGATAHIALTSFMHQNIKGQPLIGYSRSSK